MLTAMRELERVAWLAAWEEKGMVAWLGALVAVAWALLLSGLRLARAAVCEAASPVQYGGVMAVPMAV